MKRSLNITIPDMRRPEEPQTAQMVCGVYYEGRAAIVSFTLGPRVVYRKKLVRGRGETRAALRERAEAHYRERMKHLAKNPAWQGITHTSGEDTESPLTLDSLPIGALQQWDEAGLL